MCVDYTSLNQGSLCHESIKSLTRLQGVSFYASLMPIPGTTK
jgi:hypothetical protein